jgi:prephenate dehydrogenase
MLPVVDPSTTIQPAAGPPVFERVAVIGLGAIGGSIALAARAAWPTGLVIGVDTNEQLEHAARRHMIDVGASDLNIISGATLIVLARSPAENLAPLAALGDYVGQRAVVTEVGGAAPALVEAARALPGHLSFIAGHPRVEVPDTSMAAARADLLAGCVWEFFSPAHEPATGQGADDALAALFRFAKALGAHPRLG